MNIVGNDSLLQHMMANVQTVRNRINSACEKSHRDPADVRLIAVSKTFPSALIRLAVQCGINDFGENRVQEAYVKYQELNDIRRSIRLHFIGHLQTNKVKEALEISDIVHSVDSIRLAKTIDDKAVGRVPILLQVNIVGENTKFGFKEDELDGVIDIVRGMPCIELTGLMTIAPWTSNQEDVRYVFIKLREISKKYNLKELSMGMSEDFEVAVEEGATMVRIGKAIFGNRS